MHMVSTAVHALLSDYQAKQNNPSSTYTLEGVQECCDTCSYMLAKCIDMHNSVKLFQPPVVIVGTA